METERLILRRFVRDDWKDLYEYLSDENVVRYEPYPPMTPEQCKTAAKNRASSDDFWAVCLKESGKLIGNIYLAKAEQDNWEIGYVYNQAFQRKGYASEAVQAMTTYAFLHCDAHRIFAQCNPENVASWKLLERVGFRREGHLRKNVYFNCAKNGTPLWQDTYIYGMLKEK